MRATRALLKVVGVLLEGHPSQEYYGLELSRASGLKSGKLYPLLDRLQAEGWVQSRWEDAEPSETGRPRRRLYQLTATGAHEARLVLVELLPGVARWT